MSNRFNPYLEWFGLRTDPKPTYYDLLGIPNFESEPPVIAEAGELRLQTLEQHRTGPYADQAERIIREVSGVMNILLSPDKRRQYDEQLRQQQPQSMTQQPYAQQPSALPPSTIDAADSPTMMLPPGSFTIPPLSAPPAAMPPAANPYGAYPGYAAPPQAAQPAYAAATGYAAAPPMMAPQYAAAAYPPAAAPYAQQTVPPGYAQSYPPAAQPAAYAAPAAAMTAAPPAAMSSSSHGSQRARMASKKQKTSQTTMATAIIGGAGVVLAVVIMAVSASTSSKKHTAAAPKVVAKKPNALPQHIISPAEELFMSTARSIPDYETNDQGGFTYRSSNDEGMNNSIRQRDMFDGSSSGLPSMPSLVQSMAPAGVTPSIATPGPVPPATPAGTAPNPFTPPTPQPAAATAMPAPAMTPAPSAPAAPVLAGLTPTETKMEAVLPADAAREKSVNTMLGAARKSLKSRDYAKAEEIILQTQVMADTPALITSTYEQGRVLEYIRVFWTSVREGAKALTEGEELTIGGKVAKVVKHDDLSIVVKQDNRDLVMQIDKLLPGLAVMLAERGLPQNDAATKLAVACFLASDQVGDRPKAMLLLSEAAAMGADVTNLKAALGEAP